MVIGIERDMAPASVVPPAPRSITVSGRVIPVHGPRLRDPRLHLALVIVAVITIGVGLLEFRLSIPHILITVAVCAVVELAHRFVTTGALVWPASGMQTATSTVLVLRIVGVEHGDWWTFAGLHVMVGVAVLGLATKYVVRTRHGHVFNPSNVALVAAFLVLGAERIEPLDYWWGPLDWRMAVAYTVIVTGGLTLCARLGLLGMAMACWATLALGVGVLAALGHSMTTRWSFAPVEGWHLWRTIVLSPETMIFFFFMITDPKTAPAGRRQRWVFGALVGAASTLLLAPWPTEFGSKVGLLAGLTVMSVLRFPLARLVSERSTGSARLVRGVRPIAAIAGAAGVMVFGASAALAGAPNRAVDRVDVDAATVRTAAEADLRAPVEGLLPAVNIATDVAALSPDLATQAGARRLVDALLFNLAVEAEALESGDSGLLVAVDHGQRLIDQTQLVEFAAPDDRVRSTYRIDAIELTVVFPGGLQSGPNAGVRLVGTVTEAPVGRSDAVARSIDIVYTLRRTASGAWLTTGTVPSG
jgi:hypothetical protein